MRKHLRIVDILLVFHIYSVSADSFDTIRSAGLLEKQSRGIISPKMDYDEWKPLGYGDPLKNDPTFDYLPPMVSKVKYWINPIYRTPDPPIIPSKDEPTNFATGLTTKSGHYYRTTTIPTATIDVIYATAESPSIVAAGSNVKRFIIEPSVTVDTTYVQMMNSKYNQKLTRQPSPASVSNQINLHAPTRQLPLTPQPPAPLPMLVPPPPVEPSSYTSTKIENSTAVELSWDVKTPFEPHLDQFSTTVPSIVSAAMGLSKNTQTKTATTSKSVLQNLLGKEKLQSATGTVTQPAFSPNPPTFSVKQPVVFAKPTKTFSHLIIQGHSKVKKYGGNSMAAAAAAAKMAERVDHLSPQETNEINDIKFELPKDVRERKRSNDDDFLPYSGFFDDFFAIRDEGSGVGANGGDRTRAIF